MSTTATKTGGGGKEAIDDGSMNVWLERARFVIASSVVIFLVSIAFTGIANGWMVMNVHPIVGFIILFLALTVSSSTININTLTLDTSTTAFRNTSRSY